MKRERIKIGQIALTRGTVRVTDPMYDPANTAVTAFQVLTDVKKGNWNCYAVKVDEGEGERIGELFMQIDGYDEKKDDPYIDYAGKVCVDRGVCGIFDDWEFKKAYRDDVDREYMFGVVDGISGCPACSGIVGNGLKAIGVASRSGYGDGKYSLYVSYDGEGDIIKVKVVFI